ncbi:MAG: hypothetical protein ACFFC7_13685 [Candidatus Hermodarchaeota archaeon]
MQVAILQGRIITPIITHKTTFQIDEEDYTIINPQKVNLGEIEGFDIPGQEELEELGFINPVWGYMGEIEVKVICASKDEASEKIRELLKIDAIGAVLDEGLGCIKWLGGRLEEDDKVVSTFTVKKEITETVIEGGIEEALKVWQKYLEEYHQCKRSYKDK